MGCDIGFSAEGNDAGKVNENEKIKQAVFAERKVIPSQKISVYQENRKKYVAVKFIPLSSFVRRKHADPDHHIGNGDQDGEKNGKKAWIEK